ncbi:MAG: ABC transporter permease [Candidatus Acetothermia bacterium]|jgi:peptide/nickel transport system permease protein|nr:ABC transporter permease [Candidatus Acetothermia bacterium]
MRGLTWGDVGRQLLRNPLSLTGTVIIVALLLLALLAPYIAPFNPYATNPTQKLLPPSRTNLMGTDGLGRDVFSRMLYGTRISLWIALLILLIAGTLGTAVGIVAGYVGGFWDNLLMRITDVFMAFPQLILAMAVAAALGPNLTNVVIAISFGAWTVFARLARSRAIAVREEDFIEAARAVGAGPLRILFVHILPMAMSPVIIQGTLSMGGIILTAAGLGFLGFGAQPPSPEWGLMVSDGRNFMPHAWWVSTFPGLAIMITVLGFNLIGDGIRDILDPRMR